MDAKRDVRKKKVARCRNAGVASFAEEFIENARSRKFSPSTITSYTQMLGSFFNFLESEGICDLKDVEPEDVGRFVVSLRKRGLSAWSVCAYAGTVRSLFRFLEERGRIFINPASGLRMKTPDKRVKNVPTVEEVLKFLAQPDISTAVGVRNRAFLETAYGCGARLSELTGMDLASADLERRIVRVLGKGEKERMLPLTGQASEWLARYISTARKSLLRGRTEESALWIDFNGRRMKKGSVGTFCREYSESAGLKRTIRTHALRRACATHMLRNGAHPAQIQEMLGHSGSKSICHYIEATMPDIRATHSASAPGE